MRPAPCRNDEWRDPCAGPAQASPAAVSSLVRQSHHFQKTLFTPVPTSGSYSFPILSSLMVSEPCGNVCDMQMSQMWLETPQTVILCTSTRDLTISVLTAICCTKRLLQCGLRAVLIYGYRDMDLQGCITPLVIVITHSTPFSAQPESISLPKHPSPLLPLSSSFYLWVTIPLSYIMTFLLSIKLPYIGQPSLKAHPLPDHCETSQCGQWRTRTSLN